VLKGQSEQAVFDVVVALTLMYFPAGHPLTAVHAWAFDVNEKVKGGHAAHTRSDDGVGMDVWYCPGTHVVMLAHPDPDGVV
jgi:hypothetical protein